MFKRGDYVKIISKNYGYKFKHLKFHEGYVHNIPGDNLVCVTKEKLGIGKITHDTPYGYFIEQDLVPMIPVSFHDINSSFDELLNIL